MSLITALKPSSARKGLRRRTSSIVKRRRQGKPASNGKNIAEEEDDSEPDHSSIRPSKHTPRAIRVLRGTVAAEGPLRPFRLLRQDLRNLKARYVSDWTVFNQLVFASAVYVFFTNLLPGITFASDLYVLTGKNWGTIEVVFSTGLCGVIFSLWVFCLLDRNRCVTVFTLGCVDVFLKRCLLFLDPCTA
jgi:hypothetical protein